MSGMKTILIRTVDTDVVVLAYRICTEVRSRRAVGCLWHWEALTLPADPQDSQLSYPTTM